MKALLWNLALAVIWAALTGRFTPLNLAVGLVLGAAVTWLVQPERHAPRYLVKLWQTLGLALFFLWELILANLRVAYDVVTPRHHMRPGVLAVPLDARTDAEITLLANLITLTPGTLSLDVSADRRLLFIHTMYIDDPEAVRRRIKDGLERRLLKVLR